MRITSSAPHGRMHEMQHLMLFFMAAAFLPFFSLCIGGGSAGTMSKILIYGRRERDILGLCIALFSDLDNPKLG